MRAAILSSGDVKDMKGVMNFVQEKVRLMKQCETPDFQFDAYLVECNYSLALRIYFYLRKGKFIHSNKQQDINVYGVKYSILPVYFSLWDLIINKLKSIPYNKRQLSGVFEILSKYDIISTHNQGNHFIAYQLKRLYGIPYINTWHGSDINVIPFASKAHLKWSKIVIEQADMNFFVSKGLLESSGAITPEGIKDILYTGPSSIFYKYDEDRRQSIRDKYGLSTEKVVSFSGNLIPIKNVLILPEVFKQLTLRVKNLEVVFWIIGDGVLFDSLEAALYETGVRYKMFGKVQQSDMPDLMNCTDILIMPSINEGFSLSVLEARQSGSYVVASRVGGLPESAGVDNCFSLDDSFVNNVTQRMTDILEGIVPFVPLPKEYDWEKAIQKEIHIYNKILEQSYKNG